MGTNQQRREAAKRKLDRQLARRAEQAKRRKVVGAGVTIGAVVIVAGVVVFLVTRGETPPVNQAATQSDANATAQPTSGPCHYKPTPRRPAAKKVGLPPDPKPTPDEGTVHVAMETNVGTIDMTLDRAKAPCTVQSITHLVKSGFYDDTPCHRLVTADSLSVLQCGDPTGTGTGGPGYTIPDEPPTELKPTEDGKAAIYPRGTVAMAKSSAPNSGGSQFFMVFEDSKLPPEYTVFGTIAEDDLAILDKVADAGVKGGGKDGKPAKSVTIQDAKLV